MQTWRLLLVLASVAACTRADDHSQAPTKEPVAPTQPITPQEATPAPIVAQDKAPVAHQTVVAAKTTDEVSSGSSEEEHESHGASSEQASNEASNDPAEEQPETQDSHSEPHFTDVQVDPESPSSEDSTGEASSCKPMMPGSSLDIVLDFMATVSSMVFGIPPHLPTKMCISAPHGANTMIELIAWMPPGINSSPELCELVVAKDDVDPSGRSCTDVCAAVDSDCKCASVTRVEHKGPKTKMTWVTDAISPRENFLRLTCPGGIKHVHMVDSGALVVGDTDVKTLSSSHPDGELLIGGRSEAHFLLLATDEHTMHNLPHSTDSEDGHPHKRMMMNFERHDRHKIFAFDRHQKFHRPKASKDEHSRQHLLGPHHVVSMTLRKDGSSDGRLVFAAVAVEPKSLMGFFSAWKWQQVFECAAEPGSDSCTLVVPGHIDFDVAVVNDGASRAKFSIHMEVKQLPDGPNNHHDEDGVSPVDGSEEGHEEQHDQHREWHHRHRMKGPAVILAVAVMISAGFSVFWMCKQCRRSGSEYQSVDRSDARERGADAGFPEPAVRDEYDPPSELVVI